jgi:hypothetical protein
MLSALLLPTRRDVIVAAAAAGASGAFAPSPQAASVGSENEAVIPFQCNVAEEALVDLRRRVAATKWPSQELVTDASHG